MKIVVGDLVRIVHELRSIRPREDLFDRQGFVRRIVVEGDEAKGLSSVYVVELVIGEMVTCSDVELVDGDIIGTLGDIVRCVA